MQENQVGDDTLKAIAKSATFANLRKLNFYRTDISVKGVKVLAKSKALKQLKYLNLARNYLYLDTAKALAETKTITNIQTLLMFDTGIGDEGVQVIMASESFSKLKTFRVT
jgi:hypothetical protein